MSEIKHTPLPWRRISQGGSSTIVSADKPSRNDTRIPSYGYRDEDHCIAYPFIEDDGVRTRWDFVCFSHEDSALIVEACNSYYEMRAKLEFIRNERDRLHGECSGHIAGLDAKDAEIETLKAALNDLSVHVAMECVDYRSGPDGWVRSPRLTTLLEAARAALKGDAQ